MRTFCNFQILTQYIRIRIPTVRTVRLSDLKGEGVVLTFDRDGTLRRRLVSFGIYPGARVRVIRRGPFGNPIEVMVGGSLVAVREDTARAVVVRVENGDGEKEA